jgi:O-antigen ligase/Flp pilus assembly protein TadD
MSQRAYLFILKNGIYASFFSILLIFNNLLFPYITSKQIFFNVLIEILTVVWIGLLVKYPEYRPKKSYISWGLIGFFAVLFVSSVFGVDFNLSFWGDIERMLGVFHLLHFLVFYFIIITVFHSQKDWRNLLIAFLFVAGLVNVYGVGEYLGVDGRSGAGSRIMSTIGNAAYVGAYALFGFYFSIRLLIKEKNIAIKVLCGLSAFLSIIALILSGTRGAYLGFGASVIVLLFAVAIMTKAKVKKISLAILLICLISYAILFVNRENDFVKTSGTLFRLTHFSMTDATMNTRFLSWRAAGLDFFHHPILGNGYGNYAATFDKYFDPIFYNYTTESYFDKAHNNLVEIASTTGILGLITYLLIFAAVGFYIIQGWKKAKKNLSVDAKEPAVDGVQKLLSDQRIDFLLVVCLLIAYFIQNLLVFDALVTYISFMVTLAMVYWLAQDKDEEEYKTKDKTWNNNEILTLVMLGVIGFLIAYQYNVKPLLMLKGTIDGQYALSAQGLDAGIEAYKNALSYDTVLDRDSRSSLLRTVTGNTSLLSSVSQEDGQKILDYLISLGEKNIEYNPDDNVLEMQLAQILNLAAAYNANNQGKLVYYSNRALEAIDKSIVASPSRTTTYFSKAQILLTAGQKDKAIETLQYAAALNPNFSSGQCQLARVYLYFGDIKKGYETMDKCIDLNGIGEFFALDLSNEILKHYEDQKDQPRIIKALEHVTQLDPKNAKNLIELAKLYAQAGDKDQAISAAQKVMDADPTLKSSAEEFINSLK